MLRFRSLISRGDVVAIFPAILTSLFSLPFSLKIGSSSCDGHLPSQDGWGIYIIISHIVAYVKPFFSSICLTLSEVKLNYMMEKRIGSDSP